MKHSAWLVVFACVALSGQSGPGDARAREIYRELIDINTTDSVGSVTKAAEAMAARLRAAGFAPADVQLLGPDPRKHNLVARLRGTGSRRPLLLVAHLDVVEAKREDWSVDPFVMIEKDGYFYGRGTTDDKAMAASLTANLIRLKQEGFVPDRDLILALTADEEGGRFNGVEWLVKNHKDLIDAELAVNEGGGGLMKGGKYLVNEIQASEKVYQDFRLETRNGGGHSSLPVKDNAIYRLSAALSRIAGFEFPVQLNDVTRTYFERSAAVQADPQVASDMRAVGRMNPDPEAAARLSTRSPYFNSLMRTTCVATMLEGGHATNALPQLAAANVNCRVQPDDSPEYVMATLKKVIGDDQVVISTTNQEENSPASPLRQDILHAMARLTDSMWPGVVVLPTMSTGATDGRYLRVVGIPTYGVQGFFNERDDTRAHGRDERMPAQSFYEGQTFLYELVKSLSTAQ